MAVQHCQQHGETVLLQPHGHAARVAQGTVVYQRLDFHQQRPGTLPDHHHRTARGRLAAAVEKNGRRVAHFPQALLGHGEYAQLVDSAEAVLLPTEGTEARVVPPLQQDGAVDHVLQHFGASQGTVLGNVPHQEQHRAGAFGKPGEKRRAFAHLGHTARRGTQVVGVHNLNRVHHQHPRAVVLCGSDNGLDIGFGHEPQAVCCQPQPTRAHGHLLQGFFAGDVKGIHVGRQMAHGLQ